MSINDSCPCYPYYAGLPRAPTEVFTPLPLGDGCLVNPGETDPDTGCVMAEVPVALSLLNPGFELNTGDQSVPTFWDVYRARVQVGDVHSGTYKFAAEQVSSADATSFSIDLLADGITAESIDTGARTATVNCWYSSNEDYGSIGFKFYDEDGGHLKSDQSNWYQDTNATWVSKTYSSQVPAGTRFIKIYIEFYRKTGDGIGAYFDDLELYFNDWQLDCTGVPDFDLTIINPGAELGNMTGWDTGSGQYASVESTGGGTQLPHTGSYFFADVTGGLAVGEYEFNSDAIDLSGQSLAIDKGTETITLDYWQASYAANNDPGAAGLRFYSDVEGSTLISEESNSYLNGAALTWINRADTYDIPIGTRGIRIVGYCDLITGSYSSASFDDFKLTYHYG